MRYFLILIFLIRLSKIGFGQDRCGTDVLHKHTKITNPSLYKQQEDFKKQLNSVIENKKAFRLFSATEAIYTIPVVVHVIYNSTSATNISDAQVHSQIDVLNEDYRKKAGTNGYNTNPVGDDVKIEFCLATTDPSGNYTTGINRVYNSKTSWDVSSDEVTLKSLSDWPSDQYLNIWVCKLSNGVLGFARYPVGAALPGPSGSTPELDGVVIDYRVFGKGVGSAGANPYSLYGLGRTTSHEVGHWLGLVHIWGEGSGCSTDYVTDTPLDAGPNQDSDCLDSSNCSGSGYIQDMTANYLDYSPDACMNIFTTDQKVRMRTAFETAPRRYALLSSIGCCISASPASIPFVDDFESGILANWQVQNPNSSSPAWAITNQGGFGLSSNCVFIENDISNAGEADSLVSTFIKFQGIEPSLEFDLAYAQNSSGITDSLVISYSTDCSNWTPISKLYGNTLTTTSRITDNFSPLSTEWEKISIDLNVLNNQPIGRIRFENYSKGINNLYIDNINIDNINIYKTSKQLFINPYPNPTSDQLNIEVTFSEIEDVKYELIDMLGQKIFETNDLQKSSYTKTIDASGFAKGMYILKVTTSSQRAIKKLIFN